MSKYTEFFLASKSSTVKLETLEISHPSFSQTYYVVRNATKGMTATLESGENIFFEYYPLEISDNGSRENLDFGIDITLGDLGELLPQEIDRVIEAETFDIKPTVVYREFRSDYLDSPMFGPYILQAPNLNFKKQGASFRAEAPSLNINKTGEVYNLERFPMLRGFL